MDNCCFHYSFFIFKQKFIHMANGSYLYLMEYTSKTYNNVQEKSNKTSDRGVSAEEEYDDEDEQGN